MFDNFEKLSDGIYVFKNFLSEEECNGIVEELDSYGDWISEGFESTMSRTEPLKKLFFVRSRLNDLVPDNYYLGHNTSAVRMVSGQSWGCHADVDDFAEVIEQSNKYIEGQPCIEKELSIYGTVVYFNKFIGGEIYYPDHNITYAPNPGDLVIHKSDNTCIHGVKEVISEKRYSYSNHIYKLVKVPI